jgi:nucleoside-diphosphate-sugar epimerase
MGGARMRPGPGGGAGFERETRTVRRVLIIGCGYSGRAIARELAGAGVAVTGTVTREAHFPAVAAAGATPWRLDLGTDLEGPARERLADLVAAHDGVVYCVGPERVGENERFVDHLPAFLDVVAGGPPPGAFVYLSSTGVYGDRGGAWVDEETPLGADVGPRGRLRQEAESVLLLAGRRWGLPVHILRLAGIYGPGRHPGQRMRAGTFRVIEADPPLVVNRIHVEDLALATAAALTRGGPGEIYVAADDLPAPQREVADFTAALLGLPPPPGEPLEAARARLGEANLHLVADRKRCRNRKLRQVLRVDLRYPTYREGIPAALRADGLLP